MAKKIGPGNPQTIKIKAKQATVIPAATFSSFSQYDIDLFKSGKHYHLYEKLGSRPVLQGGETGTYFALWAPNAEKVSVIGNFNGWVRDQEPLRLRTDGSGIWEGFVPSVGIGEVYKYYIKSVNGYEVEKADPYGFYCETSPRTASIVWDLDFKWTDKPWLKTESRTIPLTDRSRFTRSISGLGEGSRRKRAGFSPTASWPLSCPIIASIWALPTLSSCPSWSIRFTDPGVTSLLATLPHRAVMVRRRI
jgi:hypothetical protein